MVMTWRGQTVASLSRAFLNTNGAAKHARVSVPQARRRPGEGRPSPPCGEMAASLKCDLNPPQKASPSGLTAPSARAACSCPSAARPSAPPPRPWPPCSPWSRGRRPARLSVMAWGCDPEALSADPYQGAKDAVYASVAKLVAAGADYRKAYLTLQEFFEKLRARAHPLGQALRRPAGGPGRPVGAGLRRHRRQGLHVGHLPRSGRAPHADLLRHRPHPGG